MENFLALLIIVVLLFVFIGSIISIYNRLVFLKNNTDKSFANIDVLLKQRVDEIPNLVEVVKQNANYEQTTLDKLTRLRTDFLNATSTDDKVNLSNEMNKILKSIFAISENYPTLQANQAFLTLQNRVSQIEDAISDRREFFNDSVSLYNRGIQSFPNVIFSKMLGYNERKFLQISEDETKYEGVKF